MPDLIMCADCGKMISPRAAACPHCGAPTTVQQRHVQTIEKTSKRWKRHQLFAGLTVVTGIWCLLFAGAAQTSDDADALAGWSMLAILGGVVWFFVARISAWWHHG